MKIADWFVRGLGISAFLALLLSPQRWGWPLLLLALLAVGAFGVLYPQGLLGWAKPAHPRLDVDDRSIWWVPRLLGGCFLVLVLLAALRFGWR